ncbi:MAG: 16S rRNA (cytosine(967)-C(5))-methyltransferase RsmB [Candidatus Eisenbacteria bacterium]
MIEKRGRRGSAKTGGRKRVVRPRVSEAPVMPPDRPPTGEGTSAPATPTARNGPPLTPAQEAELRFMRSTRAPRFGPRRDAGGSDVRDTRPVRRGAARDDRGRPAGDGRYDGPGGQRYAENRSRPAYPETSRSRPEGGWRRRDNSSGPGRGGPARDTRPRRDDTRPARPGERPARYGDSRPREPRRDDTRPARPDGSRPPRFGPRSDDTRPARPGERPARYGDSRPREPRRDDTRPARRDDRGPRYAAHPDRRDGRRTGSVRPGARDLDRAGAPLPPDPREAALRILIAVEVRGAFSDKLLEQAHAQGGDARDQALLHELVKGTLRWRGRLDAVLDRIVHIGIAATQPNVRNVLRLGAYQILFLDRIPAHAAVDESVKLAHQVSHAGAAGLVNSVLRRLVEEKEQLVPPTGDDAASLAVWGSHPEWLVTRWLARFGPEATRALMLANDSPSRLGLRVNLLRATRERLVARLGEDGIETTPSVRVPELVWTGGGVSPAALGAFRDGWCTAQDESEALVAHLVDPQPHERILDLCAAPGGKCTHLAERIGDEGEVWAMDRAPERVATLEQTLARLGCHSVHVVTGDGRSYTFPMPFDRVLVDAPCSSLGVIGRRADTRWRKGPETLLEMPPVQLELLVAGARRVRPGGVLVYGVCSFEPEETTAVVERFLAAEPGFTLEHAGAWLPADVVDERGFMCVLPHVHGCDGAFAARFRKS